MTTLSNAEKLATLNAFRSAENKASYADWRQARHQPQLDAYKAARDAAALLEVHNMSNAPEPVKTEDVAPVSVSTEKLPGYKVLAKTAPAKSTLEKPVEFIHAWLNENPDTKRKAAVATLVGLGVNYATARTQFQRWFNARKG